MVFSLCKSDVENETDGDDDVADPLFRAAGVPDEEGYIGRSAIRMPNGRKVRKCLDKRYARAQNSTR
jgi:hypothetical protein